MCSNDVSNSYTAREDQFLYFIFVPPVTSQTFCRAGTCPDLARASAGSIPRYADFLGALLILFSFSCQFDLAFWAFLAPFAVEVGRWEDHGAVVLLLAMVPRL